MQKTKRTAFRLPYAGVESYKGLSLLYSEKGDYSLIIKFQNPALQYSADPDAYTSFHSLLLNIVKLLGAGYIIQKQDVFVRKTFKGKPCREFLQEQYSRHFEGREYIELHTYLIITRQVKRGVFYVYDKKQLIDFEQYASKVFDLLQGAGLRPQFLSTEEINSYVFKLLGMDFASENLLLDTIRAQDKHLQIGSKAIRTISLINTESIDLPEEVSPYIEKADNNSLKNFPVDNFSFLFQVPAFRLIVFNQVIEIPNQQLTLNKLELKRKRHSGVPDAANLICVKDIDQLLTDVAKDNQLLVNAHYSMLVCTGESAIDKACNFIEAALFQHGIIPSRNAFNQLELFRCALPGNAVELKKYDWFLTTSDAALCFFFKELIQQDERSDFLIKFTDRQGIPVGIDPSDLPMRTNRINNRNRFVLGPSGSGKSFFMNALIEQYMLYNMDVVIVDTGHSYSGLCAYFKGKYITYTDRKPITMNPFQLTEGEYNLEKKDFLCTLVGLLWKGAEGIITNVERDVIANLISSYYAVFFKSSDDDFHIEKLNFNSFYEYALYKIPLIKRDERIPFDFDEFRYVLKKFYYGGDFDSILNEEADQSLFSERFIVFEIDSIKENKILFPIVTLIIMDVFIQKMRHRKEQRKCLIIEEAWKAIASPLMAGYILYLYKTIRKFWGEAIVVTQELSDILGNAVVKDSILNNSDTICLLDQSKFRDNYKDIAKLLSISEIEQRKIFTINKLDNSDGRGRFKEVYIRRGSIGEVYGVEVSIYQYLAYTTEKPEKSAVETYVSHCGSYQKGLEAFVMDLEQSGLSLNEFVKKVNLYGLSTANSIEFFKPDFL